MTGVRYQPGTSPLHRTPAGAKLLVLLALTAAVLALDSPAALGAVCAVLALGYAAARIALRRCLRLAGSLALLALCVFAFQVLLLGPDAALVVSLRLVAALSAAQLFTLTTRVDEVVSTVEAALRPLRRFGVRPERVGLAVGLTLQALAALSKIAREVREAAIARNARLSPVAFLVPLLVRTLRHSDELADALAARGDPASRP